MSDRSFAHVRYPWCAAVDVASPHPRRYYARLIGQALRYGMPARRRFGPALTIAALFDVPNRLLHPLVLAAPRRPSPEADRVSAAVRDAWPALSERSPRLHGIPAPTSVLAIQRSAGLTVFLFGSGPEPLCVAKVGGTGVAAEVLALRDAEGTGVAPRHLGRAGPAEVQEAVAGAPLKLVPLLAAAAGRLQAPRELQDVGAAFLRVAATTATTAKPVTPVVRADAIARAAAHDGLSHRTRSLVAAAHRDVGNLPHSVLSHYDASPQNLMCAGGRLTGIIDWELAEPRGMPGWDVWIAGLSYLEHRVGLARFSQAVIRQAFRRAWATSRLFGWSRACGREAARAAGVPDAHLDSLEVAFYAARLGHRLSKPASWATDAATASAMLETVVRP